MKKELKRNKKFVLYFMLSIIIITLLIWITFGYVLLNLNPIEWSKYIRAIFVFIVYFSVLTISFPFLSNINDKEIDR